MPKPKGVYRIFALGESTTVGYPYFYNASFPTFLLQRLQAIFPNQKFEVINLGMTATTSYAAPDILSELNKYQPDLIIYYGGHNEFYGALGIASNQFGVLSRVAALIYLKLIHFSTFQLLRNEAQAVAKWFTPEERMHGHETEMEHVARGKLVPYGGTEYREAYSIFRANLQAMRRYCRAERIPLIIGTQVSNLVDLPPFVSKHSQNLSHQKLEQFQEVFDAGKERHHLPWDII